MNKKNIRVRKGQAPESCRAMIFVRDFLTSSRIRPLAPRLVRSNASKSSRGTAIHSIAKHRKAPLTHPAGHGYADPSYDLSDEWRATRQAIGAAEKQQKDSASPSRVLVISAADRNDGSCPGEVSKTFRLSRIVIDTLKKARIECDDLDLSRITSEYGKQIHPCKGCVSTAMPLCHWPCSCYPNHALGQVNDWMNEIYPRWSAAHGLVIVTPVYWYQVPSAVKLRKGALLAISVEPAGGSPTGGPTGPVILSGAIS